MGFTADAAVGAPSGRHSIATGILSPFSGPSQVEHRLQVEEVRLRPAVEWGRRPLPVTEGLVEVRLPDGWSQVCDKGWSAHNSHVVCGMLGFPGEKRVNMAFYRCGASGLFADFGEDEGYCGKPISKGGNAGELL